MESANLSPVGGARKARKAATRKALKEAGHRCLAEHGYEGASVARIARGAGVAHGTFYVHFESKHALLDELLAEFNAALAERLAPVLGAASTVGIEHTVRRTARVFLEHWRSERWFVESYAQRAAAGLTVGALRDGINPPMLALLRAAFEGRSKALSAADVDADLVVHGLLALWLRVGLQVVLGEAGSAERAAETLTRMTVGALEGLLSSAEES